MNINGLDPRRTVGILVADLFEDLEFWSVAMRLREAGYRVLVIGSKAGETYTSKSGGLTATSEATSAKIIGQRKVTGSMGIKDDLENAGGIWLDEPAFRDGNRVWGRVVDDIPAYQRELIQALGNP
jgi:protease I